MVVRSGIKADIFSDMSDEGRSRQENVQELMDAMHDFVQSAREEGSDAIWLPDFLTTVALLTDQDNPHDADVPRVTLMTVHSAKGLEFDTVFVVGLEEDLFPSNMAETEMDVEEERRLFYVAITRAEKRCLLTYARTRFRYGQLQFGTRSRFLNEIDPSYLTGGQGNRSTGSQAGYRPSSVQGFGSSGRQGYGPSGRQGFGPSSGQGGRASGFRPSSMPSQKPSSSPRQTPSQKPVPSSTTPTSASGPSSASAATSRRWVSLGERNAVPSRPSSSSPSSSSSIKLQPGARIEHERFGQGSVVKIEGDGESAKAVIRFDNVGEKTLLLKFARIKLL